MAKLEINENTKIPLGPTIVVVMGAGTILVSVIFFALAIQNNAARAHDRLDKIDPRVSSLEETYSKDAAQIKSDIRIITCAIQRMSHEPRSPFCL